MAANNNVFVLIFCNLHNYYSSQLFGISFVIVVIHE